ncbi:MAG: histone deacetylase [Acidobacteriota bacterium]|nr:histone deacetylase [Acidobacteriota bacterium]
MQVIYSPRYVIDIGTHVFPTVKYRLVRDRLLERGLVAPAEFIEPETASWEDLATVHTGEYLDKLRTGGVTLQEQATLELPWAPGIIEGFRLMVGGTLLAGQIASGARRARAGEAPAWPVVVHLGGGLHHAFADHGEGFCVFNDVAVAIRRLQKDGAVRRVAIIDGDVHHGNGTAKIFAGDPDVFTFSIHQQQNYPAFKPHGSLDVGLPDGTGDAAYLAALGQALPQVFAHRPDLVFYLAGADPYEDDQLGGLRLTMAGLRERDRQVFAAVKAAGVPLAVTLAGGYARRVEDTVAIHVATVEEARRALHG